MKPTQRAADLREQRSGLLSRIEVLEGLERSHEGLGTGPRELFALLEQPDPGPWRTVLGILAEFLTVRREFAPLIDLALGERAQRFLVRDPDQLAEAVRQRSQPFSSRVEFPAVVVAEPDQVPPARGTSVGPASQPDPRLPWLALRVRCRSSRAGASWRHRPGRAGGALRQSGTGRPAGAAAGRHAHRPRSHGGAGTGAASARPSLRDAARRTAGSGRHSDRRHASRRDRHPVAKSELRELREQVADLDRRLTELDRDLVDLREALALLDSRAENGQQEIDVLSEQVSDLRSRIGQHRQRRDGLHEEVQVSRSEISELERDIDAFDAILAAGARSGRPRRRRGAAPAQPSGRRQARDPRARIAPARTAAGSHDGARRPGAGGGTLDRPARAPRADRVRSASAPPGTRADGATADRSRCARQQENQRTLLEASSSLAVCYLRKEAAERQLAEWGRERARLNQERQQRNEQAQASRNTWHVQQEQAHARELTVNDLRHRRDSLCARLHEDYQLDLAALYEKTAEPGN